MTEHRADKNTEGVPSLSHNKGPPNSWSKHQYGMSGGGGKDGTARLQVGHQLYVHISLYPALWVLDITLELENLSCGPYAWFEKYYFSPDRDFPRTLGFC